MKHILSAIVCCFLFGACTGSSRPIKNEVPGIELFSTKADIQTLFSKDNNNGSKVCASRMADVADTSSIGLGLGVTSGAYGGESINEGVSRGAVGLGGRSESVLIIRELAYRACEMSANYDLSKEQAIKLYESLLDISRDIAGSNESIGATPTISATKVQNTSLPIVGENKADNKEDADDPDDS